jgi:hypothetical protein
MRPRNNKTPNSRTTETQRKVIRSITSTRSSMAMQMGTTILHISKILILLAAEVKASSIGSMAAAVIAVVTGRLAEMGPGGKPSDDYPISAPSSSVHACDMNSLFWGSLLGTIERHIARIVYLYFWHLTFSWGWWRRSKRRARIYGNPQTTFFCSFQGAVRILVVRSDTIGMHSDGCPLF